MSSFRFPASSYATGYGAARLAVEGHALPWTFSPLKFFATAASTLSGIPGGLFAPSLSVGARFGELIGKVLGVHSMGAVVPLGMVSYFAGVTQAPITALVIIDEMTNSRGMVIPLMIAAFIGTAHRACCSMNRLIMCWQRAFYTNFQRRPHRHLARQKKAPDKMLTKRRATRP